MYLDEVLIFISKELDIWRQRVFRAYDLMSYYLTWITFQDGALLQHYHPLGQRFNAIQIALFEMQQMAAKPHLKGFFEKFDHAMIHLERCGPSWHELVSILNPPLRKRAQEGSPEHINHLHILEESCHSFEAFWIFSNDIILAQPWFKGLDTGQRLDRLAQQEIDEIIESIPNLGESFAGIKSTDFERLVGAFFHNLGYEIYLTTPVKDGGFDILALKSIKRGIPERLIIECKRAKEGKLLGVSVVRELIGAAVFSGATKAILACSTGFTKGAKRLSRLSCGRLDLVDGEDLRKWLEGK